ncbi:ATP-binding cassette (ABC) Superfamily [Phytophthora palmivora]|uniref:ATP-binding cassette (ABC) Superfamily n=1 Tax=Phytophthora palmivora TaxID=4796 RepID=A0A2P4XTV2_9STRA|nr:ATP-binding cassette (ABC) Superfamily [Phytophthora palmivora]
MLLAPHRIPLKKFTSLRMKPEDREHPEDTTTQSQAEDLYWRWVSLKIFTVQELKKFREDRLMSYVLDQRDLRIEFAHLVAKRQLHSVMEGLRQQSKSSAQDERGYGSVNPGTVHRKAAKKPRTTYAPAVDPKSQQPSGSQPGAGLPAPTSSVTRGNPATSQAAGASQSAAAPGRPAPHGSGVLRSHQGGQEEPSHTFEYEAPSQPHPSGPSNFGSGLCGTKSVDFEIVHVLGPGGQAAVQAGKPGPLDLLRQGVDALGRETRELHGRVDCRASASALKELRRGLDALNHEVHGRIPSYEPQGYSYHSAYGYGSYGSSSHAVPSYPSYESRGYQSGFRLQAPASAAPVVQGGQPRTQWSVVPLKMPHVERWVDGVCGAVSDNGRKGSNEAD